MSPLLTVALRFLLIFSELTHIQKVGSSVDAVVKFDDVIERESMGKNVAEVVVHAWRN